MNAAIIIVAAGRATRFGGPVNKQYVHLAGKAVLYHSLAAAHKAGCFNQFIVVITPGEEELFRREVLSCPELAGLNIAHTAGGETRQDSVRNGLQLIEPSTEFVCIHDGARPLAAPELFINALEMAAQEGAAVTAIPVRDTIKQAENGRVVSTPVRSTLWAAQTPQVFRRSWLEDSYRRAAGEGYLSTDDSSLLERYGYPVRLVHGSERNIKVTTRMDLLLAELLLREDG